MCIRDSDPEVVAERCKKRAKRDLSKVDPANIMLPPQIAKPKVLKKKKKPRPVNPFEPIDLTGGKLRRITQKQLDRAKKKPVPRRQKKRRKRKMTLMV